MSLLRYVENIPFVAFFRNGKKSTLCQIPILFFLLAPMALYSQPAKCQVYFSQKDPLAEKLIELIEREEKEIKIAIFCMTHFGIAHALIRAKDRGVNVEVIVDPFSLKTRSSIHRLIKANIPLFVWDRNIRLGATTTLGRKKRALMHDKFCVFGSHLVWTGSFNFTQSAQKKNQENVVILDDPYVFEKYAAQFDIVKKRCK